MSYCPICGKKSDEREITVDGKRMVNLCSTCHSFIICLLKPVSHYSRTNALNWSKEFIQKHKNPEIRNFLVMCYSYAIAEEKEETKPSAIKKTTAPTEKKKKIKAPTLSYDAKQLTKELPDSKKIKTNFAEAVRICCYISIFLTALAGGAIANIFGNGLFILGLIIGAVIGILGSIVILLFVEISENLAIAAEAMLNVEKILEDMRKSPEFSEK